MAAIVTFRDLDVWQVGIANVVIVYRIVRRFPDAERFVLSAQMRRAAISVPANIAEGHCRRSPRAYLNHLHIALGSQAELETQVEIAKRLEFIDEHAHDELNRAGARIRPMLHALRHAIARRHRLDEAVGTF